MKYGGLILWNAIAVSEMSKTSWHPGNSVWTKIWRTIQRANNTFWSNGWISSDFNERSIKTSSIWQESITWYLSWVWIDRGWIWKGDILFADLEDLENLDASEIYPRRTNAKEVLISQKGDEFKFPVTDGTAKLSLRDFEFREPSLRRERTVRSENLSGELQGESEESQPTESTDDAETRADFWSIQGDFIYRHHNERRVQLQVPKEETFLFHWKHIVVFWSTYTDLDVMQEKKIDEYWSVDWSKPLSDSWRGFTKFTVLKENFPKDICGPVWDWKNPIDHQTRSCMARVMDKYW